MGVSSASNKANLNKEASTKILDDFSSANDLKKGSNDHIVDQIASNNGLTEDAASTIINASKQDLSAKYQDVTQRNHDQQVGINGGINAINDGLQNRVDLYEKDRIGQGITSILPGWASNVVTLGNGGSNIGGPSKSESLIDQGPRHKAPAYDDLKGVGPTVTPYTGRTVSHDKEVVKSDISTTEKNGSYEN